MSGTRRVSMLDGKERVQGTLEYVVDIQLSGMLHARVLRSPYPHARIVSIDASAALELPGVVAVLTGEDLVNDSDIKPYYGPQIADQPIVAIDKVLHVGDAVAAVAAETPEIAEEALFYIDVEYDELPAVYDPVEAMAPDAPKVHHVEEDILGTAAYFGLNPVYGTNCPHRYILRQGDIEAGFAEADYIIEHTFRVPSAAHVAMEPQASIAIFEKEGLTIFTNTQTPFNVRDALAHMFSLEPAHVRVIVRALGGAYGAKTFMHTEPIAAALARKTGSPVKLVYSRAETFVAANRHPLVVTIKMGVKQDGAITAKKVEAYYNTGAYADSGPGVAQKGGYASVGPYRIPNVWVDSYAVYTNMPRNGAYRGYAVTQMAFASEQMMDIAAETIGMDALEFRLKNLLHNGDVFATGQVMEDVAFEECLREVAAGVRWSPESRCSTTKGGKRRGKGLCVLLKGMLTPGESNAEIELCSDGRWLIHSGTVEVGQGARTIIAQIAGEVLHVPYQWFEVTFPDTESTPFDSRTTSSRSTHMMGNAVRGAAQELRAKMLAMARDYFGLPESELDMQEGKVYPVHETSRDIALPDLLKHYGHNRVVGRGSYRNPGGLDAETGRGVASSHWHQGAGAVEVEVDPETGKVDIISVHVAVYAGKVINLNLAELQNEGNVLFGIGSALFEEIVFDDGQVINPNLSDYLIPSTMDMPGQLYQKLIEFPDAPSHGLGETALPTIPAAVANAVANAIGKRITSLPLTPEKVYRALRG